MSDPLRPAPPTTLVDRVRSRWSLPVAPVGSGPMADRSPGFDQVGTGRSAAEPPEEQSGSTRPALVESERPRLTQAGADGTWTDARRAGAIGGRWATDSPAAMVLVALAGACLLVIAGLWGWQRWTSRSAPSIDELLPVLAPDVGDETIVAAEAELEAPDDAAGPVRPASGETDAATGPDEDEPVGPVESEGGDRWVVHVSGAVELPGIVMVDSEARVFEAVQAAGGARSDADLDRVNLAAPVVDGERIHVPAEGEESPPALIDPIRPSGAAGSSTGPAEDQPPPSVDINRATATELQTLPGVGPALAAAIVDLRDRRGPFDSVDELALVDGIGPAKLEALRPQAIVGIGAGP